MPRRYRYHPSTVDTISWTIPCGTKKHRIHLIRGSLVLPDHKTTEIQTAFLRHHLGEAIRPCLALLIAFKHCSPTLTPPLIPDTLYEALCVARFARRTVDCPDPVPSGFSARTLTAFFHPISQLLVNAQLSPPHPSPAYRIPQLHLKGFAFPILMKEHGRWRMPDAVIPELQRALYSDHNVTELRTAIQTWITAHQTTGDTILG